jgi:hypothetical protein
VVSFCKPVIPGTMVLPTEPLVATANECLCFGDIFLYRIQTVRGFLREMPRFCAKLFQIGMFVHKARVAG